MIAMTEKKISKKTIIRSIIFITVVVVAALLGQMAVPAVFKAIFL